MKVNRGAKPLVVVRRGGVSGAWGEAGLRHSGEVGSRGVALEGGGEAGMTYPLFCADLPTPRDLSLLISDSEKSARS